MKRLRLISVIGVVLCMVLLACGDSTPPPGNGNPPPDNGSPPPDDGNPPPSDPDACAVVISSDITIPSRLVKSERDCDYFVTGGTIRVQSELFIDPGVVVVFDQDTRLSIDDAGSITAVGTPEERIVLAGQLNVRGYWYGICFGNNRESRLEYVDLLWGGKVWSSDSRVCRAAIGGVNRNGEPVHIKHSLIAGSLTSGLDAFSVPLGEFENNVFAGNTKFGVIVHGPMLHKLDAASDYLGTSVGAPNGKPYIRITGGGNVDVADDEVVVWRKLNADYYLEDGGFYFPAVSVGGVNIQIEPGTRFVAASPRSHIGFRSDSVVAAVGTPDAPIIFTGLTERPGSWQGVALHDSGGVFEHVEIRYGGARSAFDHLSGSIVVSGDPRFFTDVRNSVIADSANCALNDTARGGERAIRQSDNTFINNERDLCGVD